ncbi:MAG: sulfatase-like hydrolase/transferase, partial [Verrucomicrobiales bacterium]
MTIIKNLPSLAIAMTLVSAPRLTSAPITWGPPADVISTTDVSTHGILIEAFNAGQNGVASQTINGVTFIGTGSLLHQSSNVNSFSGTTGDIGYDALLNSIDFGGGTDLVSFQIGNGSLEEGSLYEVQLWYADTRYADSRMTPVGDGELSPNTVYLEASGQYGIGIFIADGPNQTITLESPDFGNAHINAYQLRKLPESLPTPQPPTNLIAEAGDAQITLDWEDNHQYGFSHFVVRRATQPGGPYDELPGSPITSSKFLDANVTNGTSYYYVVATHNTEGEISENSAEVSATPELFIPAPPTIPTGLVILAGDSRISLEWEPNTQPGFLEFRIQRAIHPTGPYEEIATTSNYLFVDETTHNGIAYYYIVSAINVNGEESESSTEVSATPSVQSVPPNFLFIITDDQDTYSIGAYRETEPAELTESGETYVVSTPNIDRLATEGMLFHQARIMGSWTGAVCTGSRTCIMTGRNTWDSQIDASGSGSAAATLPGIFNRGIRSGAVDLPYASYRTCKSGNSYNTANAEFTLRDDATRRGNTDGSGSEWHREKAIEHLEHWRLNHQPTGTPFFMFLGFSHPHDERNARDNRNSNPPDLASFYGCYNTTDPGSILTTDPASPPAPANLLTCTPETYPAHPFDHGHLGVRDENTAPGILQHRTERVVRNEIGRHFACVDWIDRQLGLVFEKLEDPNGDGDTSDSVMDNTYIVFTSDHGIAIGRHGLQGKQNLYEHTWRVPYLVRGPGIEPGSQSNALIYLHDTFPTFCDLAGIDLPPTIDEDDGISFRHVLEGTTERHRDYLYGVYSGGSKPGIRAITDGRFKLIKYDVDNNSTQVTQLFDLESNPFELLPEHGIDNLATLPAYASIRQTLEKALSSQRVQNGDPYSFLGDRTVLRFEEGTPGDLAANDLPDQLPFDNHGHAFSNTGGERPKYTSDTANDQDFVFGQNNSLSLDFEADLKHYVEIADSDSLDFGEAPFTLEAWIKVESLPTGNNLESSLPLFTKKALTDQDSEIDYMFLAAAGSY